MFSKSIKGLCNITCDILYPINVWILAEVINLSLNFIVLTQLLNSLIGIFPFVSMICYNSVHTENITITRGN